MMVNDHGKANAELKSLAEKQGLTVPASLDEEHTALVKTLAKAGDQFDPQYAKAQLDAHEAAVELFENYASKGENKEAADVCRGRPCRRCMGISKRSRRSAAAPPRLSSGPNGALPAAIAPLPREPSRAPRVCADAGA